MPTYYTSTYDMSKAEGATDQKGNPLEFGEAKLGKDG